jgi:serine/threonine protein kinase
MRMDDRYGQAVGQTHRLLGNYRILHLLGQGGFADVYLGEHVHLRTQAAIKVLQVRLVESNIQSFLNEARTIAHLVHPYIIRVLDFGVEANTPFLVMDYAPKGTFRQRFLHGKPLPPKPLFPYIKQAASALQYAHDKKLIHRDVKPENMLLGPNEEVLLSDFGFALMQSSISRTPSETAGTASYMAPEQLQGKPQPASDQYALGIIAYEWLTGVCPFQGTFFELASQHMLAKPPSMRQRAPGLSVDVEQVVMTALAKEPDQRFPSVRDFAETLEHACLSSNDTSFSLNSSISFPPFTGSTPAPVVNRSRSLSSNTGNALSHLQNSQQSQPLKSPGSQPRDEFETHFQFSEHSPAFPPGQKSFSPTLTPKPLLSEQSDPSSLQAFQQEQALQQKSSSVFPSLPQNISNRSNTIQPGQSDRWPFSSTSTDQAMRSGTFDRVRNVHNIPNTPSVPGTSQSGLPLLSKPDKNGITNASLSTSLTSSGSAFPTSLYFPQPGEQVSQPNLRSIASQSGMTPFSKNQPSQPNLRSTISQSGAAPSSREPSWKGTSFFPTSSQTFPVQKNGTTSMHSQSPHSTVLNGLPPLDLDAASEPRFTVFNDEQSPFSTPAKTPVSPFVSSPGTLSSRQTEERRHTSQILSIFIIAMVVLIIGSTIILVTMTNNQKSNSANPPANYQQPVSNGHVTATSKPPSPQATTSQIEQNPYGNHDGVMVLNSSLSQQDQQMQWSNSLTCAFTDGSYHVIADAQSQGFTMCNAAASDYANFVYQVQMTFTKAAPTTSSGGLVFRGNSTNHQFYFFEIFANGSYAFYRCPGTNGGGCPALSSSTITGLEAIATFHTELNQPNTIAVEANGNTFNIYVNNQLVVGPVVDTVTDPNYSHGTIGMMARQSNQNAVTDVSFSNAKLWKL